MNSFGNKMLSLIWWRVSVCKSALSTFIIYVINRSIELLEMNAVLLSVLVVLSAASTVQSKNVKARSTVKDKWDIRFTQTPFGLKTQGEFENLDPGFYSIYIYINGDADINQCTNVGEIYNPFRVNTIPSDLLHSSLIDSDLMTADVESIGKNSKIKESFATYHLL